MSIRNRVHTLRDKNQSKKARTRSQGRKLLLEQLEDRRVLAALLYVDSSDIGSPGDGNGQFTTAGEDAVTGLTLNTNLFTTIGAAVTAAPPGTTIQVADGTYNEMVNLGKALTLLGANAGIHPAVGMHPTETVGTRGAETILSGSGHVFIPAADDITIDGFKFTGDGGRIIDTYANANNFHLTNSIFENDARATSQGVIQFGGGSHTGMKIDFNLFQDKGDHTFYMGGGPYDGLTIEYNKFNVYGDGVFWTATPLVNGVVRGNEFDGTIDGVPGDGGVGLNIGQGGNIQIVDNWFHDMFYTAFQVGIDDGTVSGNTFQRTHAWSGYWGSAFELWGGQWGTLESTNVSIEDNIIHFNDVPGAANPSHGIRLRAPEGGSGIDASTIDVNNNQFVNGNVRSDAKAVWHQGNQSTTLDAEYNWWDTIVESEIAALMQGPVDYIPYLTLNTDMIVVDDNWSTKNDGDQVQIGNIVYEIGLNAFDTIQEGVTAVDAGGTVQVYAGMYNERVTINRSVTVNGAEVGVDARTRDGMETGESVVKGGFLVNAGVSGVTIDGFYIRDITTVLGEDVAVYLNNNASSVTVQNTYFLGEGQSVNRKGIVTSSTGAGDMTFTRNSFKNLETAVYVNPNSNAIEVSDSKVEDSRYGYRLISAQNVTVTGNQFLRSGGLQLRTGWSASPPPILGLTVSGNDFSELADTGREWVGYFDLWHTGINGTNEVVATNNTFEGKSPTEMTLTELFRAEDLIHHATDVTNSSRGVIRVKTGELFVSTNSGYIQSAIDAATAGDLVNVESGSYTENVSATAKQITLAAGSSPGQVLVNGNLTLNSDDTLQVEINGTTPGTQHDQLVVNGTVTLGGAALVTSGTPGGMTLGDTVTLIANDGADAVSGTFAGLPADSVVVIDGEAFRIYYNGGTGNDVVLIRAGANPSGCVPVTYVDDDWAGAIPGSDPDGAGPATSFGVDAFATINAAIDHVCAGGTVNVAAGTYAENVLINKRITLDGAGSGIDGTIIDPLSGTGIALHSGGDSALNRMILKDLRVTGASGSGNPGSGIQIQGGTGYTTFENVASVNNQGHGIAINMLGALSDLVINDSTLSGNATGLRIPSSLNALDGLTLLNSQLNDNVIGLEAFTGVGQGGLTNVTIEDTQFNNNSSKGMYLERLSNATMSRIEVDGSGTLGSWAAGIDINLKFASYQNITIQDSTIKNSGTGDSTNGVGITIKARDDSPSYAANPATLANVTLSGNVLSGNQTALRFGEPGKNNAGPSNLQVIDNSLTGSVSGVELDNQTLALVDASGNWWGSTSDAAILAKTSGSVDFTPYLSVGTDTSGNPGFQGDFSTLYVTEKGAQTQSGGRINEAIGLVTASTVIVNAGTYTEHVTINKEVTLLGAQSGVDPTPGGARVNPANESILDITSISPLNPNVAIEITEAASNVTIDGFTLIGQPGTGPSDSSVLRLWADDTTIENNIISGGVGILNKGADDMTVNANRFAVNKNGVVVQSPSADLKITGNSFSIGNALESDPAAIQITGVDGGLISNNTATGFTSGGSGRAVGGSNNTDLEISDNTFTGNHDAISLFGNTTFVNIVDNDLINSVRYGINLKGQDVLIDGNTITNSGTAGISIENHTLVTQRVTISDNTLTGNATGIRVATTTLTPSGPLTFQENSITGGINAFVISTVGELNLTNNTTSGNTSGGSITSATTVNLDSNNNANIVRVNVNGAGAIALGQFSVDGQLQAISFTGVGTLDVDTLGGEDIVLVAADPNAVINLDGGDPASPDGVDTLTYFSDGVNAFNITSSQITTANRQIIYHANFEDLNVGGNLVLDGTGDDDTLDVTATGINSGSYVLTTNGVANPAVEFSNISSLVFNGLDGDDRLIIRHPAGSLFNPASGVTFHGGAQANDVAHNPPGDSLEILGGSATSVEHRLLSASSGEVQYNGSTSNDKIIYTGLEPVLDTIAAGARTFKFQGADEIITLSNATAAGQSQIDSTLGEKITFTNPTTSLTINTEASGGSGADTVNVTGVDSAFVANVTINTGSDDDVNFTGALNLPSNVTVADARTISVDTSLATTGAGEIDLTASRNIVLQAGSSIATVDGTITLDANSGGSTTGSFVGVLLDAASITSSNGDISITGHGGDTGDANVGVSLANGAQISSTGTGPGAATITITGTGGAGQSSNDGIRILHVSTSITSIVGNIRLEGNGGSNGTVNSILGRGVAVGQSAVISSTGVGADAATIEIIGVAADGQGFNAGIAVFGSSTRILSVDGDISLTGTGGSDGSADSDSNDGIVIFNGARIVSSGTGENAADITIDGAGGDGDDTNEGVSLRNAGTMVTAVDGDILIRGTGGSNGLSGSEENDGVEITDGVVISSTGTGAGAGTITIEGTGADGQVRNDGVKILDTGTLITSIMGAIQLDGVGGSDGTNGSILGRGVAIGNGAKISSTGLGADAATIDVDGEGAEGQGFNAGIAVFGTGTQITSVDGSLSLNGVGGSNGGSDSDSNDGIVIIDGAQIVSSGIGEHAATIVISGSGGSGDDTNEGVSIRDANTMVSSVDGSISISGIGGSSGSPGSEANEGVEVVAGAVVSATGSGSISILGDGAAVSASPGIFLDSTISSNTGTVIIISEDDVQFGVNGLIDSADGLVSITADNAVGNLGGAITMANGALIDAGSGDIDLSADGHVTLGGLSTTALVTVTSASGSILDGGNTHVDISATSVLLTAAYSIGSSGAGNALDTAVSAVTASSTVAGGIWIEETDAVTLTSVTTNNGTIEGDAGGTITATTVTAGGSNDVRLTTSAGDIALGVITAAGDTVLLQAAGAITDGNAGDDNINASSLAMTAGSSIGAANAIETTVSTLAASAGDATTDDIWVVNTGDLTIGEVEAFSTTVTGVTGGGDATITALSSLTVDEDVTMTGSVLLTATDKATTGDDLTVNTLVTVQGSSVELRAGDNMTLADCSTVIAATTITLLGDYGNADTGVGSVMQLLGTLNANGTSGNITVEGNSDADTITVNPGASHTADGMTIDGKAGNDTYHIYLGKLNGGANAVNIADADDEGSERAFVYGTSAADTLTVHNNVANGVNPQTGGFVLLTAGAETVNYTATLDFLTVEGNGGNDLFDVQPSQTAVITIDGGAPSFGDAGVPPGDTIDFDSYGNTFNIVCGTIFTNDDPAPPANGTGPFKPVHYQNIENMPLDPLGTDTLRFDMDAAAGALQSGYTSVLPTTVYGGANTFGWDAALNGFDRGTTGFTSEYTALLRDGHWNSAARTFRADVAVGWYLVSIKSGDKSFARDQLKVTNPDTGQVLLEDASSPAGQIATHSFVMLVTDGTLDLTFEDAGGDPYWVVNGIEIRPGKILTFGSPAQPTKISDGISQTTFPGYLATPGELVTVLAKIDTSGDGVPDGPVQITTPDADPDLVGVQIRANDGSATQYPGKPAGYFEYTLVHPSQPGTVYVYFDEASGDQKSCLAIKFQAPPAWQFDFNSAGSPTQAPVAVPGDPNGYIGVLPTDLTSPSVGYG
ncbi:MAG: right-handed parallel beta-helix repeat-containing protein, partial [Pirellulaceae bacterium]|nr:right-handed parallel beta-helix repeat-containing protein [Pirellulaceae bacterium]